MGIQLKFVFFTCSPFFTLGLTILADVRKYRPLYVVISEGFVNLFVDFSPLCGVGGAHASHVTAPHLRSQGSHHLRVSRAISRKIRQLSSIARPVRLPDVI